MQIGRQPARAVSATIEEKATGSVQANIILEVDSEKIVWRANLVKKDGSFNDYNLRDLRACFGWDGADFFWFEDADISQAQFDAEIVIEPYQGKEYFAVKRIYAQGDAPASDREALRRKYGAKLRALSGGVRVTPPATTLPIPEQDIKAEEQTLPF